MKQTVIALCVFFSFSIFSSQAQSYKLNKQVYDYKMYSPQPGDPNNPTVMGVASWLVPGLGQMISGETGRGLSFLGGYVASVAVMGVGYGQFISANLDNNQTNVSTKGLPLMLAGILAGTAIDIWSIVDAVRVAKVNNMYFQDQRGKGGISLQVNPYFDANNYLGQTNTSVGLSMKVTF